MNTLNTNHGFVKCSIRHLNKIVNQKFLGNWNVLSKPNWTKVSFSVFTVCCWRNIWIRDFIASRSTQCCKAVVGHRFCHLSSSWSKFCTSILSHSAAGVWVGVGGRGEGGGGGGGGGGIDCKLGSHSSVVATGLCDATWANLLYRWLQWLRPNQRNWFICLAIQPSSPAETQQKGNGDQQFEKLEIQLAQLQTSPFLF